MDPDTQNNVTPVSPPKAEEPKEFKTLKKVTLPSNGATFEIHKLKAGKHYEAQKKYVDWFGKLQEALAKINLNVAEVANLQKGQVDTSKIEEKAKEVVNINLPELLKLLADMSSTRLDLLAYCVEQERTSLEQSYYAEDIDVLFAGVCELNNFFGNIKKSEALIAGLGA